MDYGGAYSLDDPHLETLVKRIVWVNKIDTIIETGTNAGLSTVKFCRMVPNVVSIDIDPDCTAAASALLAREGITNCRLITANSPDALCAIPALSFSRALVFIDAHMQPETYWPVDAEIAALPRGLGILMFHDIKVPDRDFLFSQFRHHDGVMRDFSYESIRDLLYAWSPTHRVEYNREAAGSRVGVAVVYPS